MTRLGITAALFATTLAGSASAQDFNIDVANLLGSPANTYGAATGQVGFWNVLTGGPPYAATISDLSGTPTSVMTFVTAVGNGLGDFMFNNASTTGDDEALMDDLQDIGDGGASSTMWTFSGLNPTNYDVTVYSWAPDSAAFVSTVEECGTGVSQMSGGAWPAGFALGVTHVQISTCAEGGTVEICVNGGGVVGNFPSVNGYQFTETGGTCGSGTAMCFASASCPCGNTGDGAGGCDNSVGGGGVILAATGTATIGNDTLVLTATRATNQPGVFFQGNQGLNPPPLFGDGFRCCGMGVVRIGTYLAAGNTTNTMTGNLIGGMGPPISTHPGNGALMPGDSRCYQYWYRDPSGPCGSGFNLSNSVLVNW